MEKFDLIIVGTGFASSFFLKKYLEKAKTDSRVLVLERGVFFPHSERLKLYRGENRSTEFSNIDDIELDYDNPDKTWVFDANFGGSSNCWTGCTPRFMPNDFKMKSTYGVGVDWPIGYETLEPYYNEVEDIMMIGGPVVTPFPKSKAYPLPPQHLSTVDRLLQAQHRELYISQPTARATIPTGNRNGCCTSTVCSLCPIDSKFTIENSLLSVYKDSRVEVRYECQVYGLVPHYDVVRTVVYRQGSKDFSVQGEVVALGANAIFNAHILLSSGDTLYYTGRGLSDQRGVFAYFYFNGLNNVGASSIISANGYMFYDTDKRSDYAGCLIESFNDPFIRNEPGRWRQLAKFKFIFEDLPNDDNRVMLSADLFKPRIQYKLHDPYVERARAKLAENIDLYFSFLPIERIEIDSQFQKSEFHICATTRMGLSAEDSVIDNKLIHHQYRNLFVLGSGAFPTITPANPTLTLSALSLWAAESSF